MSLPTFSAGQRLTGAQLQAIVDQVNSLTAPGWTSYTPTWTASVTNPTLGNGTLTAAYRRPAGSDLVMVRLNLTWGSTTTNGSGIYSFTLPFTAATAANQLTCGSGQLLKSADIRYPINCYLNTTTTVSALIGPFANTATTVNNRGGDVTAVSPAVPATGNQVSLTIAYQVP